MVPPNRSMTESGLHSAAASFSSANHEQLAALLNFSLAVNQPVSIDEILDKALQTTSALVACDEVTIVLVDLRRNQLERDLSTGDVPVDRRVSRPGGATRWIVDNDVPLIVPDSRETGFDATTLTPENGIGAYVGIAIAHADTVYGVLYALWRSPFELDVSGVGLLQTLAQLLAAALFSSRQVASLHELNEYMGGMLQIAAHDLRSPLGTAIGTLHMFSEELFTEKTTDQGRALRILDSSLNRMRDLIEGILNYERWSGSGDVDWQPHDLNSIARKVVEDVQDAAVAKSQELEFDPADGPLVVVADGPLLREAIGNLLSNASKYTPEGGRIILRTVNSRPIFDIIIEDNGPGIAREDLDKLFLPFVRLREGRQQSGSGLGLSLVRKIAERHGGQTHVESELGKGSRFIIRVPEMTL